MCHVNAFVSHMQPKKMPAYKINVSFMMSPELLEPATLAKAAGSKSSGDIITLTNIRT